MRTRKTGRYAIRWNKLKENPLVLCTTDDPTLGREEGREGKSCGTAQAGATSANHHTIAIILESKLINFEHNGKCAKKRPRRLAGAMFCRVGAKRTPWKTKH